jgi:hypothetical protein
VPSLVTLRGAGRRATVIDIVEPIGLGQSSALEDLLVIGFSGSGPAVQVSQDDVQIDGVEVIRLGSGVAEALRVEGGEVTVRDSALSAGGDGGSTNVRAVNARGLTNLIDTDVEAFSGFGELRGILVENGSLDMVGGSIVVDDNETPGFTPVALRLAGGASTVRDTEIQAFNSDATGVHGVEVANTASSLSGISVRVSSSATDLAIEAAEDVTVERSQLVATGAGDVGIQTTDAGAAARVATSRIAASTTAAGTGTESCVFSYGPAFNALSAACL